MTVAYDDFWSRLGADAPTTVTLESSMPGTDVNEVLRRLAARGVDGSIVVSSGLERRVLDASRRSAEEHDCALQPLRSVRASKGDLMVDPAAGTRSRHPASSSPRPVALADVAFVASAAT